MTLSDRLSTELIDTVIKADVGAYTEKELQAYLAPGQVNFLTRVRDKLMHDIEADLRIELIGPHDGHYDESRKYCPYCVESDRLYAAIEHYCRHDT